MPDAEVSIVCQHLPGDGHGALCEKCADDEVRKHWHQGQKIGHAEAMRSVVKLIRERAGFVFSSGGRDAEAKLLRDLAIELESRHMKLDPQPTHSDDGK